MGHGLQASLKFFQGIHRLKLPIYFYQGYSWMTVQWYFPKATWCDDITPVANGMGICVFCFVLRIF